MPFWLSWLLPIVINLIETYGIPELEKLHPSLIPIINEILKIFGGTPPTQAMKSAADHYNALSAVAVPPQTLKN